MMMIAFKNHRSVLADEPVNLPTTFLANAALVHVAIPGWCVAHEAPIVTMKPGNTTLAFNTMWVMH